MSLPVQSPAWFYSRLFYPSLCLWGLAFVTSGICPCRPSSFLAGSLAPGPGSGPSWGCLDPAHLDSVRTASPTSLQGLTRACLPTDWKARAWAGRSCAGPPWIPRCGVLGQMVRAWLGCPSGALLHPIFSPGSTSSGKRTQWARPWKLML